MRQWRRRDLDDRGGGHVIGDATVDGGEIIQGDGVRGQNLAISMHKRAGHPPFGLF